VNSGREQGRCHRSSRRAGPRVACSRENEDERRENDEETFASPAWRP
jgi:hypothetical protein